MEMLEEDLMTHGNDHLIEPGRGSALALQMEEVVVEVLRETDLSPADRATLENAVRVARTLQKTLAMTG